jgi:hypothetical protein
LQILKEYNAKAKRSTTAFKKMLDNFMDNFGNSLGKIRTLVDEYNAKSNEIGDAEINDENRVIVNQRYLNNIHSLFRSDLGGEENNAITDTINADDKEV